MPLLGERHGRLYRRITLYLTPDDISGLLSGPSMGPIVFNRRILEGELRLDGRVDCDFRDKTCRIAIDNEVFGDLLANGHVDVVSLTPPVRLSFYDLDCCRQELPSQARVALIVEREQRLATGVVPNSGVDQ